MTGRCPKIGHNWVGLNLQIQVYRVRYLNYRSTFRPRFPEVDNLAVPWSHMVSVSLVGWWFHRMSVGGICRCVISVQWRDRGLYFTCRGTARVLLDFTHVAVIIRAHLLCIA